MSAIRTLAIGAILLGPLAGGTADAASLNGFTSFWTIGDSLSDPGNLYAATGGAQPQSPPYYEGRFSNGPVWAETVAKQPIPYAPVADRKPRKRSVCGLPNSSAGGPCSSILP